MRKLKQRGAQETHGKQGDRDIKLLKLANSKSKKINITTKLLKNNNKKRTYAEVLVVNKF